MKKNDNIIIYIKINNMKYIGAHIKKDISILNTIKNIKNNNGNALQIFVSSPMNSSLPNIEKFNTEKNNIIEYCNENNFKLIIHGSYVINLANNKINKRIIDIENRWWINLLIKELDVCELLNAIGVIIHVGKYTSNTKEIGLDNMYLSIKYILDYLKKNNYKSKLIIETPSGVGTELLTNSEEFIKFYNKFNINEKKNLGICIDTAHIWSAGYDIIKYYECFKNNYNDIIVIHFNNSKLDKGSLLDRHEYIFEGKIILNDLKNFLNKLKKTPLIILEKPSDNYDEEINWIKKNF
jgi:deoxyribonuclease IV